MPSNVESQFLTALSRGDLITAHTFLEDLSTTCSPSHHRFLRALYKAQLSASNLPGAFAEMMEVAASPDLSLQTALYICVEGSSLAFQLFDIGRMERVLRMYKRLCVRYPAEAQVTLWKGSILLNQANLAAHVGAVDVITLYKQAAQHLSKYDRFWCRTVAAYARLAIALEYAGRPKQADQAVATAEAWLTGEYNNQEVLLARASILLSREQPAKALAEAVEAHRHAELVNDHFVAVKALRCQGEALRSLGQTQEATLRFARARDLAVREYMYYLLNGPLIQAQAQAR